MRVHCIPLFLAFLAVFQLANCYVYKSRPDQGDLTQHDRVARAVTAKPTVKTTVKPTVKANAKPTVKANVKSVKVSNTPTRPATKTTPSKLKVTTPAAKKVAIGVQAVKAAKPPTMAVKAASPPLMAVAAPPAKQSGGLMDLLASVNSPSVDASRRAVNPGLINQEFYVRPEVQNVLDTSKPNEGIIKDINKMDSGSGMQLANYYSKFLDPKMAADLKLSETPDLASALAKLPSVAKKNSGDKINEEELQKAVDIANKPGGMSSDDLGALINSYRGSGLKSAVDVKGIDAAHSLPDQEGVKNLMSLFSG